MQNASNVASDLRLLYELKNASDEYKDKNGYFSKRAVAKIAAASLIITSAGKVGTNDLLEYIEDTSIPETDNAILQNTKLIMQNLRMLGVIATDYDSEQYAITDIGNKIIESYFGNERNPKLLMELFMNVNPTTEVYDHDCSPNFRCYIGYLICYAFSKLDFRISTSEMPMITTYTVDNICEFITDAQNNRLHNVNFSSSHPHFPKTQKGTPIKQVSNLTRKINQILRFCGIIQNKPITIEGTKYYTCTDYGKIYATKISKQFEDYIFLSSSEFRKRKIFEKRRICIQGLFNIYKKAGLEENSELKEDYLVFSPYQMIPDTSVNWLLGIKLRDKPEFTNTKTTSINSTITAKSLRIKARYNEDIIIDQSKLELGTDIAELILQNKILKKSVDEYALELINTYKNVDKSDFYPFVHKLLSIIGIDCKGEVGRYDGYCTYRQHIIPVEIKSFTETPTYNMKGLRQAIDNKICSYNPKIPDDLQYGSLVVGFGSPTNETNMVNLIESAKEKWKIKILVTDVLTLAKMSINRIWHRKEVDLEYLLTNYGVING